MSTSTANAITPVTPLDAPDIQSGDAGESANGTPVVDSAAQDDDADADDGPISTPSADEAPHGSSAFSAPSAPGASHALATPPPQELSLTLAAPQLPAAAMNPGASADALGAVAAGMASASSFLTNQTNGPTDPVSDLADEVVQGDLARSTYGVDGTGIKIGIISNSFDLDGGAATDEADGALPPAADVHIIAEGTSGDDEGRAMAQIVHTIAPGAQIYFYTCGDTDASMAQAITALQQQGCQVIVDDVTFFDEPFYEQGGTISQAVDQVVADGTTYFTAAGNSAESFYEGAFNPIAVSTQSGREAQDFDVAGSLEPYFEPITLPTGYSVSIDLQWNQPFLTALGAADGTGSTDSMGFELFNSSGTLVYTAKANEVGGDPIQLGDYTNHTGNSTLYLEVFQNGTGPQPGQFKIIIDDNAFTPVTFDDPNGGVGSGTVIGHEADPNAISVGAAPESDPTTMEPFSSVGPGISLFDASGDPLPSPVSGGKVNLVGADGNETTVSGFANFYGTSAAAPTAAAVGALVLQENAALDPADIGNILADTATPIAGPSDLTGAGLVDALQAVGDAQTLTFTATASTTTLLGTHLDDTFVGGPGNHTINGEGGVNTLDYSSAPGAVTVDFATGLAVNGYGGTDSIANIQIVKGSAFADAFVAGGTGETLYGGGGLDTVDFSALAAGGALAIDGGTFTADGGSDSGTNAGTILVADGSTLQIAGTLANDGALVANDGDLDVTGGISGAGSALVENGGVFEIGGVDGAGATFGGTAATLKLDQPGSFAGPIDGLTLGDTIDFVSTTVSSGTVSGSVLTVTESGGTTLTYAIAGSITGDIFSVASDHAGGTDLTLSDAGDNLAAATINGPTSITLGNARIGGTLGAALSITNSAPFPAEALDVALGGTTGDASEQGSIDLLGDGATDTTDIVVGLGTAGAGAQTGSVTLGFLSDGTGTDGAGTTPLPSQTVQLSGTVYREATPTIGALPQNFIVHVGDTVAQALAITNSAAADGYSENLVATIAGTSGGVTAQGSTGDIAAQGASSGIAIGFSTTSAGSVSGSVTLALQSDGTGIDGLGAVSLGSQTVAVNATVDNYATSVLQELSGGGKFTKNGNSYTLSLGTIARGAAPVIVDLGVANGAAGPADLLSGSFTATSSSAFALAGFGAFSGLGSGQADDQPTVTFSTSAGGTFSETITLSPTGSNASGYSGALAQETLTITGNISTIMTWAGPNTTDRSGNWTAAADWSPAVVPTSQTTAVISNAGSYTVASTQSNSVGFLTLSDAAATLAVSGGSFAILGNSSNAGTIAVGDSDALQLTGTMTNTGTIALNSAGGATDLAIAGSATLKGAGRVTLGGSAGNAIVSNGALATLTNQSTIVGSGTIGDALLSVTNSAGAVIDANGAATALTIAGRGLNNAGLIEATGSAGLVIAATITQASGGVIAAAGANVYLEGATLDGDTLQTSSGGLIETVSGTSTLSGTTSTGTVAVSDGTALALKGTVTNNGTVTLNATGRLVIAAATTTKGSGSIALGDSAANAIVSDGVAVTLTNQATIAGSGTIGDSFLSLANSASGVMDATGVAAALTLAGMRAATNAGLIEATGSAGLVIATTVAQSTGGVIAAAGGNVLLEGATLTGGTLQTSGGSLIETASGANTLSGTTSTGTVAVTDGTSLSLKSTITDNGIIALDSAGRATDLVVATATTVKGSGAITMTDEATNAIVSNGAAVTLTNQATIDGSGTIGDSDLTLVNAAGGTIDATGSADPLAIATGTHTVTNSGLIEATGSAGLTISGALANNGTLAESGGKLTVSGAVTGTGQATIAGGTLDFGTKVAATQAATFAQNTSGVLELGLAQSFAGTVAGLASGDAIDLQNFQFGATSISGVAAIVQGGTTVGAAVTLKDGTLSATISLLNQFGVPVPLSASGYTLASDLTGAHPGTLLELAPPVA